MIKNVIFDMDGVIFDSERACLVCWSELAKKYGLSDVEEVFTKCIGTNKNQTAEIVNNAYSAEFGPDIADKLLSESSVLFHQKYDNGRLPLKSGVREILDHLKERGYRIALASSTKKATVERELTEAGLIGYFELIVGGDIVKISKPNPEIYLLTCKELMIKPEDAYAIEDSFNGIRAAHAANMHPVMVPDMIPADSEMRKLSEVVCNDLFEVIDYFSSVNPDL